MSEQKSTYSTVDGEEKERARLAAHWLGSALAQTPYDHSKIKWEEKGFRADVYLRTRGAPVIEGHWNYTNVGDLLSVYSQLRNGENFTAWLRSAMGDHRTFLDDGTAQLPRNQHIEYYLETLPAGIKMHARFMRSNDDGLLYPRTAIRFWQEIASKTEDGRNIASSGSAWTVIAFTEGRQYAGTLTEALLRYTAEPKHHYEVWSLYDPPKILDHEPGLDKCLHGQNVWGQAITDDILSTFAHDFCIDYYTIHWSNQQLVEVLKVEKYPHHNSIWEVTVKFSAKGDAVKLSIHPTDEGLEVFATDYPE